MTELRAQGDIQFSRRLMEIGQNEPELWREIRLFFRRKEFATALLVHAEMEESDKIEPTWESGGDAAGA